MDDELEKRQVRDLMLLGAFILFVVWLGFGGMALAFYLMGKGENAGHFGDFFGCFNALVSAFGFGAVIYGFWRQRQDAKEADQRHRDILTEQQRLFNENTKISLFEKRILIVKQVRSFFSKEGEGPRFMSQSFEHSSIHLADSEAIEALKDSAIEAQFLFSDVPEIRQLINTYAVHAQNLSNHYGESPFLGTLSLGQGKKFEQWKIDYEELASDYSSSYKKVIDAISISKYLVLDNN